MNPCRKGTSDRPIARDYEIRVVGHLDRDWEPWFGDVTIAHDECGETLLLCRVVDQAALYGLLHRVRDLGMPLVSVIPMTRPSADPERG